MVIPHLVLLKRILKPSDCESKSNKNKTRNTDTSTTTAADDSPKEGTRAIVDAQDTIAASTAATRVNSTYINNTINKLNNNKKAKKQTLETKK